MRTFGAVTVLLALALPAFVHAQESTSTPGRAPYTIVIHGGAGTIDESMPDSVKKTYVDALSHALRIGKEILEKGLCDGVDLGIRIPVSQGLE